MFIKKDKRKIPEILVDENDERHDLKLSKRAAEFNEDIKVLRISTVNTSALCNLRILNLYDNHIKSLEGIGHLDVTPIEEINLGCNDLNHLPFEFGRLQTLRSVWLDDNHFEEFPTALCQLSGLTDLRFSSNQLATLPPSASALSALTTLALDNNLFSAFPEPILSLHNLEHLWLRQNRMQEVPEGLSALGQLITLSLSSNALSMLPTLIAPHSTSSVENAMDVTVEEEDLLTKSYFQRLQKVYLNGNKLTEIPDQWAQLPRLQHLNLANNSLLALPSAWTFIFTDESSTVKNGIFSVGEESDAPGLHVNIFGNPVLGQRST